MPATERSRVAIVATAVSVRRVRLSEPPRAKGATSRMPRRPRKKVKGPPKALASAVSARVVRDAVVAAAAQAEDAPRE